jgi:hypothetical protein
MDKRAKPGNVRTNHRPFGYQAVMDTKLLSQWQCQSDKEKIQFPSVRTADLSPARMVVWLQASHDGADLRPSSASYEADPCWCPRKLINGTCSIFFFSSCDYSRYLTTRPLDLPKHFKLVINTELIAQFTQDKKQLSCCFDNIRVRKS